MTLYLARHGETDYNRSRLMQGQRIDASLNEHGVRQADALADRFRDIDLDAIYSSPLLRARETADRVAHAVPTADRHELTGLKEMSWGTLEGRPIDEVGGDLRAMAARWATGEFEGRLGGGETILEVRDRAASVLETIRSRHAGQTVLAITHGRYLRVLLAHADPSATLRDMEQYPHANTGVYRLRHNGSNWRIDIMNCTEHLEALAT